MWLTFAVVLGSLLLPALPLAGQEDEDDPFRPGLIGRYESPSGAPFERIDRSIAFAWNDATPDRRVSPGKFQVQWRGRLQSQANGTYQLRAYFAGRLKIVLNDQTLIDAESHEPTWRSSPPLELSFDDHRLRVRFEKTNAQAQVALFWSGPQFQTEPLSGRQLFHDREETSAADFERGAELVRALRCAACHDIPGEPAFLRAPSLEHLAETMERPWLEHWLTESPAGVTDRRMPHFGLTNAEAQSISTWLFEKSLPIQRIAVQAKKKASAPKSDSKKKKGEPEPPVKTPVEAGRELLLTVGCLACHQLGEHGVHGLFDGGDLSAIAAKRPPKFFRDWLLVPETINSQHRMPVYTWTGGEEEQLSKFLSTLGKPDPPAPRIAEVSAQAGEAAVAKHRCAACHSIPAAAVPGAAVPGSPNSAPRTKLAVDANWAVSCAADAPHAGRPHFALTAADRSAIQTFLSRVATGSRAEPLSGSRLLVENNCLSCHQREESPGLAERLVALGTAFPDLASQIPAMTPPPLNSVGDKFVDGALRAAITRQGPAHRPYLRVRMPQFKLSDAETQAVIEHFIAKDRIPPAPPVSKQTEQRLETRTSQSSPISPAVLDVVGSRLVTPDGFGCTSCHQIGRVMPVKAPLNARGPDLSMLATRVRREWFDRWVRNPSRIVPRMEMPSVQIAVRGVLHDNLDQQLSAVWDVLNKPGFQPPLPDPVRVVRQTGTHPEERAIVVTDVLRDSSATLIKPLLIGLSNRHNILFDLETAKMTSWSIGDTARQRTEGKSWFWEAAGNEILRPELAQSEISWQRSGAEEVPQVVGQFVTEFDSVEHVGNQLRLRYRLTLGASAHVLQVVQTFSPLAESGKTGFRRTIELANAPAGNHVRFEMISAEAFARGKLSADHRSLTIRDPSPLTLSLRQPSSAQMTSGSIVVTPSSSGAIRFELDYLTPLPVDQFLVEMPPPSPLKPETLQVVPGFSAVRLPLTDEVMPTAMTWRPDGTLVIASLKGQIWQATDTDRDGLADHLRPFSDELAAPWGLFATDDYVDVVNKYAVLRLSDDDHDGRADRTATIASGWGHTADYHDWAVGLPRDDAGNYYVALSCQQDQRSPAAANRRGEFLQLVPREPTPMDPRLYDLRTLSRGHRFPMGIARRRDGELFVTDNQGNYNPFNELNHIQPARHFGFINAIEKGVSERPPLTPPAVNLPHPWVRSVNGICFLETPQKLLSKQPPHLYGPFEGHLLGCEYDTRRLIRMSLQKVGDVYQGAAYPFSSDAPSVGPPLLGPLVCEVAPDGDIYVGGIRDSGWGGANNIGEVVRLRLEPSELPCGIAEMRTTHDGFELDFTQPVDRKRAAEKDRYSLASYTRESTPAYGGPDLHRRTEKITDVQVSGDRRRVTLRLAELRPGFVYELHVKKLVDDKFEFFPAEAHFTLWRIP